MKKTYSGKTERIKLNKTYKASVMQRYMSAAELVAFHEEYCANRESYPDGRAKRVVVSILLVLSLFSARPVDASILSDINTIRVSRGLQAVQGSTCLDRAVYEKNKHMIRWKYWEHVGRGIHGTYFVFKYCNQYEYAGEVLARGYSDSGVVRAWMRSPSHRAVLLNPTYKYMAVRGYNANTRYITAHFGR